MQRAPAHHRASNPLSQTLRRKPQLQRRALEHHKLRLEEDIPKDGEADAGVALDATKARCGLCKRRTDASTRRGFRVLTSATHGCIGDVGARDNGPVAADAEGDAREGSGAWVGVTTLSAVVDGARDSGVIGRNNGAWEVEQGSASVWRRWSASAYKPASPSYIPAIESMDVDTKEPVPMA